MANYKEFLHFGVCVRQEKIFFPQISRFNISCGDKEQETDVHKLTSRV